MAEVGPFLCSKGAMGPWVDKIMTGNSIQDNCRKMKTPISKKLICNTGVIDRLLCYTHSIVSTCYAVTDCRKLDLLKISTEILLILLQLTITKLACK